jgi:molybdopterin/thiamine biosynthesis adenylyltransferase
VPTVRVNSEPRLPLKHARVLVVGVGGLGCPAAALLGQAGVGRVTLVDGDVVALSNLHRQLVFDETDLGQKKAPRAAAKLGAQYPATCFIAVAETLSEANAQQILSEHDFVIDATDRWATKLWLHDVALRGRRPLAHAGAVGWHGQALTVVPGTPGCLRCLLGVEPGIEDPSCQEAGVVPGVVQTLGVRLAAEAIAWLSGWDESLLVQRFLYVDAQRGLQRVRRFAADPHCPACSQAYDQHANALV